MFVWIVIIHFPVYAFQKKNFLPMNLLSAICYDFQAVAADLQLPW